MDTVVYTIATSNIKKFLEKIQSLGVPEKLTLKVLESLGFKSTNERSYIPILKAIGFVSSEGIPTDRWKKYRDKGIARSVLAEGIREYYESLYKMYPDAHRQDNEALTNYFSTQTTLGKRAVAAVVQTFKVLVENADFESLNTPVPPPPFDIVGPAPASGPIRTQLSNQGTVININIQLTLPDTQNIDTYEAIFKALKRHILC